MKIKNKKFAGFTPTPYGEGGGARNKPISNLSLGALNSKRQKVWGFTLLELLVVIVIIGLIAGIVLTVVYMSKTRAKKSRIVSDLDQIRKTAELFYNSNNYSFVGLSNAPDILTLAQDISDQGGELIVYPNSESYVAFSTYPGASTNNYWCVDNQGSSKATQGVPSGSCGVVSACPLGQASPYNTCSGYVCVPVVGCGVSSCSSNQDCGIMFSSPPRISIIGGGGGKLPPK